MILQDTPVSLWRVQEAINFRFQETIGIQDQITKLIEELGEVLQEAKAGNRKKEILEITDVIVCAVSLAVVRDFTEEQLELAWSETMTKLKKRWLE